MGWTGRVSIADRPAILCAFNNLIYLEMRSESPAVANPGSTTTKCEVFPDGETMNCTCRSGIRGFTPVEIPVQSGFTV